MMCMELPCFDDGDNSSNTMELCNKFGAESCHLSCFKPQAGAYLRVHMPVKATQPFCDGASSTVSQTRVAARLYCDLSTW